MPDPKRPNKEVALVTGANQGIGLQIAKDLVAHGLTVLVGWRNFERGEAASKTIAGDARAIQLDVTDRASIAAAADRIREEFGSLDVLINNAAISNMGSQPGMTIADYSKKTRPSVVSLDEVRAVWETNVFGVLAVFQAMLPLLRAAPHARVVNVSSSVGSLTANSSPNGPYRSKLRPRLSRVENRAQRDEGGYGDRARIDRNQGQCRVPRLYPDRSQQVFKYPNPGGRRRRGRARRAARSGQPDRHVHARNSGTIPW